MRSQKEVPLKQWIVPNNHQFYFQLKNNRQSDRYSMKSINLNGHGVEFYFFFIRKMTPISTLVPWAIYIFVSPPNWEMQLLNYHFICGMYLNVHEQWITWNTWVDFVSVLLTFHKSFGSQYTLSIRVIEIKNKCLLRLIFEGYHLIGGIHLDA